MTPRRVGLLALALLLVGAAVGLALRAALPGRQLYVVFDPVLAGLLPGAGLAAGVALAALLRERGQRRNRQVVMRERERAREDRRRFLLRLDHELKNPLQAIRVAIAQPGGPQSPPPSPLAQSVDGQVVRLGRLVGDLRKLAELEVRELELERVDVSELLAEVRELADDLPGAAERDLRLVVPQAPWPLPAVLGDRDLLAVALHNLVANAVKYSGPGDTVELRAAEADRQVVLEVADTGSGIPEAEQAEVWDELARGTGARGIAGSGLGLALVRVIVARHGGTAALRSRPGTGTVVTLTLPAVAPDGRAVRRVSGLRHRDDVVATPAP